MSSSTHISSLLFFCTYLFVTTVVHNFSQRGAAKDSPRRGTDLNSEGGLTTLLVVVQEKDGLMSMTGIGSFPLFSRALTLLLCVFLQDRRSVPLEKEPYRICDGLIKSVRKGGIGRTHLMKIILSRTYAWPSYMYVGKIRDKQRNIEDLRPLSVSPVSSNIPHSTPP